MNPETRPFARKISPVPWKVVILLLVPLLLLCADLGAAPLAQSSGLPPTASPQPFKWAPLLASAPTSTPFQPVQPTDTPVRLPAPTGTPLLLPSPSAIPSTKPAAAESTSTSPSLDFWGINFGDHTRRVTLQIVPPDKKVNRGLPILISFIPGDECIFGDHRACVYSFRLAGGPDVIFISVHSGVGGEAQAYRSALEGTGVNQAAYTLQKIRANLLALNGAAVTLTQGDTVTHGLVLAINARVPAQKLESYFNVPVEQALASAAAVDPLLKPALAFPAPELVIETCGWKSPEEPWSPTVISTSASIYLGVIQKSP